MKSSDVLTAFVALIIIQCPLQAQWQLSGIARQGVHALMTIGDRTYAGADSGVYRSTNDGLTWERRSNSLPLRPFFAKAFATAGSSLFAGTNGAGVIYITTDEGGTWTVDTTGLAATAVHALVFDGSVLIAGTNGNGVFRSTNSGGTWQEANSGISNLFVHALLVRGTQVLAGSDGGVFVSTDLGEDWSLLPASPTDIRSLASTGSDLFAATNTAGVFKSTDNGASWMVSTGGLTDLFVRAILAAGGGLFAGTKTGGIFLSTNGGTTWSTVNSGLDSLSILSLEANATTLYAGTEFDGIWTRPLSQVVGVGGQGNPVAAELQLEQNYPNPFNPSTVIRYQIPGSSRVVIKVFDALGEEVATLVNGMKQPGEYSVTWDATNCSNGMYFCRLAAGGHTEVRKMILMK